MFKRRPRWWQLALLIVLLLASLLGVRYLPVSSTVHQVLQVVGIIVGYLLLLGWLRINARRIEAEDQERKRPPTYEVNSISVEETEEQQRDRRNREESVNQPE